MSTAQPTSVAPGRGSFLRAFGFTTALIGIVAGVVFVMSPEIDLQLARTFYRPGAGFTGQVSPVAATLRALFVVFYYASIVLVLIGLVRTRAANVPWLSLKWRHWLFVAVCLGAGPGLVANLLFKDQWGRARPKQVAEFGGQRTFSPALVPARECQRSCSFVSGEAASTFVPFYAAALILPRWSAVLAAAGTLAGLAAGLVRMSQGAHFLSDIVFAGVFMALTVLVVHWLMFSQRCAALLAGLRRRRTQVEP